MSKLSEDHAVFLSEFTAELGQLFEVASSDIDRVSIFVEWFAEKTIVHGYDHGVEDTLKHVKDAVKVPSVHFGGKSVPKDASMGKVVASRKYPVDGWQTFGE